MKVDIEILTLKYNKRVLICICLLYSYLLPAQHNNNWAIGWHRGITFNTTPPSLITTAVCWDTVSFHINDPARINSSYSDCNGKLTIYGSGSQLWNRNHKTLKNGYFSPFSNLYTSPLIPMPGSTRYIFYFYYTSSNGSGGCGNNRFLYAIVDMDGDGGMGEVIVKDKVLDSNFSKNGSGSNNITYTFHQNRKYLWIIHGATSKTAKAYLLTDTGLITKPIVSDSIYSANACENLYSSKGIIYSKYRSAGPFLGHFKMTHDGKNLIASGIDSIVTKLGCCLMYDFDKATGKFNNPQILLRFSEIPIPPKTPQTDTIGNPHANFYFTEIAPNDTFIYFASHEEDNNTSSIVQVNRYTFNKVVVKRLPKNHVITGMQIGPDSKIYSLQWGRNATPSVNYKIVCINKPNLYGATSDFEEVLQDSFIFTYGFPYVYQPYYKLYYTSNLDGTPCVDTATFKIHVDDFFRKVKVFYGDGDSAIFNPPFNPSYLLKHHYKKTGKYYFKIQGLNPFCDYYTTVADSVYVALVPKRFALNKKVTPNCGSSLLTVRDSFINTRTAIYKWQQGGEDTLVFGSNPANGSINKTFTQQNAPYKGYWKLSIGNKECPNYKTFSDSALLSYLPQTNLKFGVSTGSPKDSITSKNNKKHYSGCEPLKLIFTDSTTNLKGGSISAGAVTWFYKNGSPVTNLYTAGNYIAIVNDTNTSGCTAADTFYITAYQLPKPQWQTGNLQQCFKGNLFDVTNNSFGIQDSVNYSLYWGDSHSATLDSGNKVTHRFTQQKNYNTSLIAESKRGCVARIDTVLVLYPDVIAQFNLNKDSQCLRNNQYAFTLKDTTAANCYWSFGDSSNANSIGQIPVKHHYNNKGNYAVQNITSTSYNCRDTATKNITILESPKAQFSLNDTGHCADFGKYFELSLNSIPANTKNTINWGDGKPPQQNLVNGKYINSYNLVEGKKTINVISVLGSCKDTATKVVEVYPWLSVTDLQTGLCLGENSYYTYTVLNNVKVLKQEWYVDNVLQSTQKDFVWVYTNVGTYYVQVKITTEHGCDLTLSWVAHIKEKLNADFSYVRLKDNFNGTPFHFTDLSNKGYGWNWSFANIGTSGIQHPDYTFKDTGNFKVVLIVYDENFCHDTAEKIIPVFDRINFFFPNAFSPNDNNINDGFGLDKGQYYLVKKYHLAVFNRWGEKIFESDDMTQRWNGSVPEKSQQGFYLFKVLITDVYDIEQEISGAVEVLK